MKEKTVFAIGLFNVIRLYCLPFSTETGWDNLGHIQKQC